MLAKGLIGLVLPALVVLVWLVVSGQARTILRLVSPLGLAVFALIAAPWFIAVQQQYPGFARYFFIYQHFERFTASGFNNPQPWWFFLVALPLLTLPWSLWLARARFRAARRRRPRPARLASADVDVARDRRRLLLAARVEADRLRHAGALSARVPDRRAGARRRGRAAGAALRRVADRERSPARSRSASAPSPGLATRYDRDNTALAHALRDLRAPGDPVVFVDEYFFDIPLHARLAEPVPVITDWHDPKIAERDNWRRELAEAAPFAPERGASLLVDAPHGYALRCGKAPLWAVVKLEDDALVAAQPAATRVLASNRAVLWRLAPLPCAAESAPKPAPSP